MGLLLHSGFELEGRLFGGWLRVYSGSVGGLGFRV